VDDNKKIIAAVLMAIAGSTGINQAIQLSTTARFDPFTGNEGRELRRMIISLQNYDEAERKECATYRQNMERRLSRVEALQGQVMRTLKMWTSDQQ